MNKISCDICKDLMPLVKDGIASEDSCLAVKEHVKECEACKLLYENETAELMELNPDLERELGRLKRRIQIFSAMLLMFGVFFGLSLTASSELFLNSLIMPVIGCIGYYLFRWKSLYITPALILCTHFITNTFGLIRGSEHLDVASLLMWSALYSIFSILGSIIAGLIHFAFRKEN